MGILDKILPNRKDKDVRGSGYKTFTEYSPVFSSYDGGVYEQELTRAAIERFAVASSKLKPEITGTSHASINRMFRTQPNQYMSWPKFLARTATVLECDNTAYIIPIYAPDMHTKTGIFPLKTMDAEVLEYKEDPWIRFYTASGDNMAYPLADVCILTRFQYTSDFFGDAGCLHNTMQLIHSQEEAQTYAIKNGAKIRFIGALTGQVHESDMEEKRKRFVESNLTSENDGGLMLYDQTFSSIKQVDSESYVIDNDEMERIENNVYNYFGTNQAIIQNSYDEDAWAAYYEGKVEPFAVQLGSGLTDMFFTDREQINNQITFSSNRLQYASNASKRNMIKDMLDRGVFTVNEARDILQLPRVPDGDVRTIRGEYKNANDLNVDKATDTEDKDTDAGDDDMKSTDTDPEEGDEEDAS